MKRRKKHSPNFDSTIGLGGVFFNDETRLRKYLFPFWSLF